MNPWTVSQQDLHDVMVCGPASLQQSFEQLPEPYIVSREESEFFEDDLAKKIKFKSSPPMKRKNTSEEGSADSEEFRQIQEAIQLSIKDQTHQGSDDEALQMAIELSFQSENSQNQLKLKRSEGWLGDSADSEEMRHIQIALQESLTDDSDLALAIELSSQPSQSRKGKARAE